MTIRAVIFDMDGVLIDSEPFWHKSEIEVFKTVGIHLKREDCFKTIGLRIDRVVQYWYERQPWPTPPSLETIGDAITEMVTTLIVQRGEARPGVYRLLELLTSLGIKLAIASSSDLKMIEAVVERLKIADYFDFLHSAEFEPYPKPHPGVYITTAHKLGLQPSECVVIEDSVRGIISAKSAEMLCIGVPDESFVGDARLSIADRILNSLTEFDLPFWHSLNGSKL